MHDVTITGLRRVMRPKPNLGGSTIIAFFDCEANGFLLAGCALVKTAKGGFTAWAPRIETGETRRAVDFASDSLQHEIKMGARDFYRALGGTDIECIGSSRQIGTYAVG